MRKILAMMLSLCMLLAAIPAMAEDVSGQWHVIMMGLNVADFDLQADGTAVLNIFSSEGEVNMEGTWVQEGEKISIIVDDNALPLTIDGETLQLDKEGMAALGLDASSMTGEMDSSLLSSLIQISREPGKLTSLEFAAYQEDGTLPEGMTEADMQAVQAEMMIAAFTLMSSGAAAASGLDSSDYGADGNNQAMELTILEDNFYVREGYGGQEGVYIAKVQNDNAEPVYLDSGSMALVDAEGNEIGKAEYFYTNGSRYLDPGEATFLSMSADVEEGMAVADHAVALNASRILYQTADSAMDVAEAQLRVEEGYFTSYYTAATITNTSDAPLARINVVVAVRESTNGKLMGLTSSGLYQNELAAGSTITLVDSLDSRVTDYCEQNGLTLEKVEAIAWVDSY